VAFGVDTFSKIEAWGVTDILDLQLTDNLTLRNIANYSELKNYYSYDGDGTIANVYDGNPFTARSIPRDDVKQFSEELQLQGEALESRLEYVLGGFYFKNKPNGLQSSQSLTVCPLAYAAFCGDPGPTGDGADNPFASVSIYGVTSESYAAYAQGTYDLGGVVQSLDGLRLTMGYRYTWDKVDGFNTAYNYDPGTATYFCTSDASISLTPGGCTYTGELKSSRPTWIAGLDYKLRPNLLLYGKVSTGYKSGGFSTFSVRPSTRTFGPEEVTAYELGFKSDFTILDAPVRLNVDVFQTDYDKIQRASSDYNVATGASGAQTLSSASARMRGIEIEAVAKPTQYLEVGGNYSHIDAEYTSFPYVVGNPFGHEDCSGAIIPFGGSADMSCLDMQYLAPNIANVYARVSFRDNVSLFLNYAWTDDQHTEALQLEKNQPGERLESYGLLSASFDWRNINGGNLDLSVFATNLTDEEYRISPAGVYEAGAIGVAASIYGEPRMVGARLKYHWGQ
jgi:iron complex outermembrane recepter protein